MLGSKAQGREARGAPEEPRATQQGPSGATVATSRASRQSQRDSATVGAPRGSPRRLQGRPCRSQASQVGGWGAGGVGSRPVPSRPVPAVPPRTLQNARFARVSAVLGPRAQGREARGAPEEPRAFQQDSSGAKGGAQEGPSAATEGQWAPPEDAPGGHGALLGSPGLLWSPSGLPPLSLGV